MFQSAFSSSDYQRPVCPNNKGCPSPQESYEAQNFDISLEETKTTLFYDEVSEDDKNYNLSFEKVGQLIMKVGRIESPDPFSLVVFENAGQLDYELVNTIYNIEEFGSKINTYKVVDILIRRMNLEGKLQKCELNRDSIDSPWDVYCDK